jgi:phosphatidylserine/phosphatidylglycerophosphate/cardiolipin synthase-like enzyme
MKLLIQPGEGATSLVKAINAAKSSVEVAIFRFDQREIEKALTHAVGRGVSVRALIAHTNRAGEDNLRRLEMRLLAAGVTVARTADDLPRYHGKFMIVDQRELFVLAFNLTYQDMEHCRSFGIVTRSPGLVREAARLFDADSKRVPYAPDADLLVISPVNARQQLSSFIQGARKQLLIYDPKISDSGMFRHLEERARAGVDIRIIGKLTRESSRLAVRKLRPWRLHTRTMIRDGQWAFVGSQSLRGLELDMRREVGIIFRDKQVLSELVKTFQDDWSAIEQNKDLPDRKAAPAQKLAREVAKAVARELPAVAPVVDQVVKELAADPDALQLNAENVEETVNEAVRQAVKEAIQDAVEQAAEQTGTGMA